MENIKQLLNKQGESVYPAISEEQIAHKANKDSIGELTELATEIKSSLVLAINENVANIETNKQDIQLLPSEQDVMNQITNAVKGLVKTSELDELITATSVVIAINDSLLDIRNNKADKSEIPTKISELANDKGFITSVQLAENKIIQKIQADILDILENIKTLATKNEVSSIKAMIPKKISDLTNDSSFVSKEDEEYVNISKNVSTLLNKVELLASQEDLDKVKTSIPTKVSQLENDSEFITKDDIPTGNIDEIKSDIENLKLTKAEKELVTQEIKRLDDLIEAIEIPEGTDVRPIMKAIEELKQNKADRTEIPTKVSELINDLEFLKKEDIGSHQTIVSILADIVKLTESDTTNTQSIVAHDKKINTLEGQVDKNTKGIALLQSNVGTLDSDMTIAQGKLTKVEEVQASLLSDVKLNKDQIQTNKESIESINATLQTIPKQTSDLINDSGFITKENVIGMDLKDNQSIKNLETKKANKEDIPTKLSELAGLDLLQTKVMAKEEHALIQEEVNKKANKTDIPTKLTDLENDMNLATEGELNKVKKDVSQNTLDISTIKKTKRVYVSKDKIPVEDRIEGNLYLQFGKEYGRIEDSVGDGVALETNKIVELGSHPLEKRDGQIYVLSSNGKAYITLGGSEKPIALIEDINKETKPILESIKALQSDLSGITEQITSHTSNIESLESSLSTANTNINKANEEIKAQQGVLDGIGRDIVGIKEKNNAQDSQISSIESKKANKEDVTLEVGKLEEQISNIVKAKADKTHTHTTTDVVGLDAKLKDLEQQASNKGVTSINTLTGDVVITGENIPFKEGVDKPMAECMLESIEGLNRLIEQKADKGHTHAISNISGLGVQLNNLERNKADKADIPKKTSELTNDSGFITKGDIPEDKSFKKYTQSDEPKTLNVGDEWHKIL